MRLNCESVNQGVGKADIVNMKSVRKTPSKHCHPIRLNKPWERLSKADRLKCEKLGLSRTAYENSRNESDDMDPIDMISGTGTWGRPRMEIMRGDRAGQMNEVEQLFSNFS